MENFINIGKIRKKQLKYEIALFFVINNCVDSEENKIVVNEQNNLLLHDFLK